MKYALTVVSFSSAAVVCMFAALHFGNAGYLFAGVIATLGSIIAAAEGARHG